MLVAATYQAGVSVTLTFNQAIDLSAFNGEAVVVEDGPGYVTYIGSGGVTPIGSTGVRLGLVAFEEGAGSVVTLNAPATTGLTAVNGGGTWAGVMNVLLPFP